MAAIRAVPCASLVMILIIHGLACGVASAETGSDSPVCRASDRDALLRFKDGIGNSSSAGPCLSSWTVTSGSCCEWRGVKCDAATGYVVELNVSSCALDGVVVPESLGNVSALEVLDLSENALRGDLPGDLLRLGNLSFLSIAANGGLDSGSVTADGRGFNSDVFINGSFDFGALANLRHLDLGLSFKREAGAFTWRFPSELCKLQKLAYLNMRGCYLHGTLPECFGSQMSALEFLDLSENDLQDDGEKSLLDVFGNLTRLQILTMDQVGSGSVGSSTPQLLSGSGSLYRVSALSRLRNLSSLTLAGVYGQETELGEVLSSLQELNGSLVHLDLRENNLTGVIPHSIQSFGKLRYVDLGGNVLNGSITDSLFQLGLLEVLHLDRNHFGGLLPPAIGNLGRLQELNVSRNSLGGAIPEEIGQCFNLTTLDLSNNNFNGSLPKSIGNLTALRYLSLLKNENLGGDLPPEIGNLTRLEFLDVSHDSFTGTIPYSWGENLSRLQFLHMTYNNLSGDLPLNFGNLTSLRSLDLSYNYRITGPLPRALGFLLSGVERILFCDNQMTGEIPPEWNNLGATLRSLSMYHNNLTGSIPNMTNFKQLQVLDLSYNSFTGAFPAWIEGSRDTLRVLELSENRLEGTLPPWLSSFTSIQIMNLGGNLLTGSIPEDLSKLTTLTQTSSVDDSTLWTDQVVVTASGNSYEFDIITDNIKSLDFNGNKLTGHIPPELGALQGLIFLSLADCNLSGTIPWQLSNLSNLETLDLSLNQLSGPIPPQLGTGLVHLHTLNLSNNDLSGPVPGGQFRSFNWTSFQNNPLLCGAPLSPCASDSGASAEDSWDDVISTTAFVVGIAVGFLITMLSFMLWSPSREWLLHPVVNLDHLDNRYFKHPKYSS